jgi:deoxyadenosine/deoxycytidine kinase
MPFQYIAIEGPIGVGKSSLAERIAGRLDATAVLEETDNPFLSDFYGGRPEQRCRRSSSTSSTDIDNSSACNREISLRRRRLCDYLFDKDKIFAYLNLDDNELFIYQRLYDLLAKDIPAPDLVVYLQAPSDVLVRRLRERAKDPEREALDPGPDYLRELNEAYQHFFFHYSATPLLVVETSQLGLDPGDEAVDDLVRQIRTMNRGTRYYVPRT